mmetsp:Transcript_12029/g.33285  ORF Transcript_12029/g.33285 Transcript_12029/m.33285 type:complete len:85 (+) Transcript_12029:208-462(+)
MSISKKPQPGTTSCPRTHWTSSPERSSSTLDVLCWAINILLVQQAFGERSPKDNDMKLIQTVLRGRWSQLISPMLFPEIKQSST